MKKASLLPLLAALALFTACTPQNGNNAHNGSHSNNSSNANGGGGVRQDVNVNVNANVDTPLLPSRTKEDRTVVIIVYLDDKTDSPKIAAAPDKIELFAEKNQKLRFHVFNNLEADLTKVKVKFKTGVSDPLEDVGLEIDNIPAGGDKVGRTGRIKGTIAAGMYAYSVEALVGAGAPPPELDPEIIINRDR